MRTLLSIFCSVLAVSVALASPVRSSVAAVGIKGSSIILPYDARIAYLESTGSQIIETDIPDNPLQNRVEVVFSIGNTTARRMVLLGSTGATFNYIGFRYTQHTYFYGNNGATTPLLPCSVGDVHIGTYEYSDNAVLFSLDGDMAVYDTTLISQGMPFSLFGLKNGSNPSFTGRIYSFRVIEKGSGNVLSDLYPVRFTNSLGETEGAMYDSLSNSLYRNTGNDPLIIGPDL